MADPTETTLTDAQVLALNGATFADTGTAYCTKYSVYQTADYRKEAINNRILAAVNQLRVVKDGDDTFGVWSGLFMNDETAVSYVGAATQALTNDDTNYIYLTPTGTLTVNITGWPATRHIPLATIAVGTESAAEVTGKYDHVDIVDYRTRAIFQVPGLADGVVAVATCVAAVQDLMPNILITPSAEDENVITVTIQARDAGNASLAEQVKVSVWASVAAGGVPATVGAWDVTTGVIHTTGTAHAAYDLISDSSGTIVFTITEAGADTAIINTEFDGKVTSSTELEFTA